MTPKVADFGLARWDTGESTLTREGDVLGTPAYMPPEQARGDAHGTDGRGDVYSLGVVLYELLTGEVPFRGSPRRVLAQVLEDEPRRPRSLDEHVPRDLETICLKCLEKSPPRRYAGAGDLAEDLRRFLAGQPIRARPVGAAERAWKWVRRRPTLAGLLAVSAAAGLVLLAGGVAYVRHEQELAGRAAAQALAARRSQYAAEVSLAYEAWGKARPEQARELLLRQRPEAGQPDLRGFAWYHLWGLCEHDLVLRGHDATISQVAFSPDGRTLASAGQDKVVKLWDTTNWTERATLRGHEQQVYCLAFAPDNETFASAGFGGTVRLWDVRTGRPRAAWPGNQGCIWRLAFSPDGRTLAGSGSRGAVRFWDVAGGAERAVLTAPIPRKLTTSSVVFGLAWAPDGKTLAAGYWADYSVKLWDLETGRVRVSLAHAHDPTCVAFAPDGRTLVTDDLGTLRLWDPATGQERQTWREHTDSVRQVAFTADGQRLAAASWDGTVKIWDPATGRVRATLKGHTGRVFTVAWAPDGRVLATAGEDRTIALWDADGRRLARPSAGPAPTEPGPVVLDLAGPEAVGLAFSPDGRVLAVSSSGPLRVWDLAAGRERPSLSAAGHPVNYVGFLPDGNTVAGLVYHTGQTVLWDFRTGLAPILLPGGTPHAYAFAVSPDGRTLASGGGEPGEPGVVHVWDVAARRVTANLRGHDNWIRALAFSPDGRTLASGSADETVRLWDVATGRERAVLRGHRNAVYALAFSPDGHTLASGSADTTVKLWDWRTGRERATLHGYGGMVYSLAFTPAGETLASGSHDGSIKLWDTATGRELATLQGPGNRIITLAFSPDGTILASGSWDGTVALRRAVREVPLP